MHDGCDNFEGRKYLYGKAGKGCMADRYMAYVGSYSYSGKAKGITVFDVNVEDGSFKYRCEEEVDNSSYLCVSHSGKTLYSELPQ